MQTSQDSFTAMKGHVIDGMNVRMNCGDVFTIKSSQCNSKGVAWDIYSGNDLKARLKSAFEVESFIVNAN